VTPAGSFTEVNAPKGESLGARRKLLALFFAWVSARLALKTL